LEDLLLKRDQKTKVQVTIPVVDLGVVHIREMLNQCINLHQLVESKNLLPTNPIIPQTRVVVPLLVQYRLLTVLVVPMLILFVMLSFPQPQVNPHKADKDHKLVDKVVMEVMVVPGMV
jgi:hypothetical protein